MTGENLSIIKVRDVLMVTMPADPDDATVSAFQESVLLAMERPSARGVVLDVSAVESLDSFFARVIAETTGMFGLMDGGWGVVGGGVLNVAGKGGLELIVEDDGPGIADIDQAMQPGYTTGGGLGFGLHGAKRLMDEMEVESEAGKGTKVTVKKWRKGT